MEQGRAHELGVKVEVDVLCSQCLIVRTVTVPTKSDIEPEFRIVSEPRSCVKVEMDVLGLPVPNSPYGLCGRKATVNELGASGSVRHRVSTGH